MIVCLMQITPSIELQVQSNEYDTCMIVWLMQSRYSATGLINYIAFNHGKFVMQMGILQKA